jgi:hypothetical protein
VKKNIIYFVAFFTTFIINGQTPPAPGGGGSGVSTGCPGGPCAPVAPISDYFYLLIIVGLWYGVKKIKSLSTD